MKTQTMQRRISRFSPGRPGAAGSILLYGFGLALALSLLFNGFLLYEQSHQRSIIDYEVGDTAYAVDDMAWQQLSECKRANMQKDSLIRQLEHIPNAPPEKAATVH
ncbi:hypothetical protein BN8_03992 [Fibrisoma limi BUZ 3]|uniref:Uncharacterized protein n=2 Tax=Fibrisoma limi TaxID=663275 RepID=I2GLL1_9BACT|nr:hypothetical protein BN8_03992 [Fibrisoma limi BUZ 3]